MKHISPLKAFKQYDLNTLYHIGRKKIILHFLLIFSNKIKRWINHWDQIDVFDSMPNEFKNILEKNKIFFDLHKNQRAFVIGNGPSLKTQNLDILKDENTFVCNAFYRHSVISIWQPSYYCFTDPILFDGSKPMKEFFINVNLKIKLSNYFVPIASIKMIQSQQLLPLDRTYYVLFNRNLADYIGELPYFTKSIPGVQSVSQLCIMAAMYMGCNPIYLLGMDHDWLGQRGMDRHFYDGKTIEGHKVAHGNLDDWSYKSDLIAILKLWNGYENIKTIADHFGIQIYNATNGGFLDVFPRVNYSRLLRQSD